jgi:hypothetical protein
MVSLYAKTTVFISQKKLGKKIQKISKPAKMYKVFDIKMKNWRHFS